MQNQAIAAASQQVPTRRIVMGVVFLAFGLLIILLFIRNATPEHVTTFVLNPGRQSSLALRVPQLEFPTLPFLYVTAALTVLLAIWQLVRGFGNRTNLLLGIVALIFVLAFLAWAARGKSLNLTGMLENTLVRAMPILLAALCGVLCERAGVVNIGLEGMMLAGCFVAALVGSVSKPLLPDTPLNLWIGLLAAVLTGGLLGLLLGVLAIRYKVDQIIAGTAINILATGFTSFLSGRFLVTNTALNAPGTFRPWSVPLLARIPVIGPLFFEKTVIVYIALLLVIVIHFVLFYTRWGLRTRAVGEHPRAADTLGVNVFKVRYINTMLGGCVAGLAGAYLVLSSVGRFDELMTAGRGFIGLAAMIFGKWTPIGSFGASLIFGFASSLQENVAILGVPVPSQFMLMAPYVITMVVLAGVVGRAVAPAADGKPYEKQ